MTKRLGNDRLGSGQLGGFESLPAVKITRVGATPVDVSLLVSEEVGVFDNDGLTYLSITATSHATVVEIFIQEEVDHQEVPPHSIEVKVNETKLIGPFPTEVFNNEEDQVEFELSITEGVTADALRLSPITYNAKGEPRG